jgi:hypothetical protein
MPVAHGSRRERVRDALVNEFLELLLEARGYWYWLTACINNERMREPKWFKEIAPKLFPTIDMSRFVPRTDAGEVELP